MKVHNIYFLLRYKTFITSDIGITMSDVTMPSKFEGSKKQPSTSLYDSTDRLLTSSLQQHQRSYFTREFRNAESTHRGHAGPVPTHHYREEGGQGKWVAAAAFRVAVDISQESRAWRRRV